MIPVSRSQQDPDFRDVLIVGAGISGLSAAYTLQQAGVDFLVVDQRPRAGGVMETRVIEGCQIEGGPDSYLAQKPWATALIRKLGMEDQLVGSNDAARKTFIVRNGKLVPMPDGLMMMVPTKVMPMVTTPLLSWPTKVRMGLELFRQFPGGPADPANDDRSVSEFFRSHYGQEAVDYLAEPLLAGIYGGDPERLSARSVLPRFVDIEAKYGSLSRGVLAERKAAPKRATGPLFLSLRDGMGSLVSALVSAVGKDRFLLGQTVLGLDKVAGGYRLRTPDQELHARQVILALPAYTSAHLLGELSPDVASLLLKINYNSSATVAMVYAAADLGNAAQGFGFLVPKRERTCLAAVTYVQNKFPHRVPQGKAVVRCFVGKAAEENPAWRDNTTLLAAVRQDLGRLTGIRATPIADVIFRWSRAMAQYEQGHLAIAQAIPSLLASHTGLHITGNFLGGIGLPDCIREGESAATLAIQARPTS